MMYRGDGTGFIHIEHSVLGINAVAVFADVFGTVEIKLLQIQLFGGEIR